MDVFSIVTGADDTASMTVKVNSRFSGHTRTDDVLSAARGALPPVLFRAVCLVRAIKNNRSLESQSG